MKYAAVESKGVYDLHRARLAYHMLSSKQKAKDPDPETVHLADAVRDSLVASERIERLRVREAEESLKLLRANVQTATERSRKADFEVGALRAGFQEVGIAVDCLVPSIPGFPDPLPLGTTLPEIAMAMDFSPKARSGRVVHQPQSHIKFEFTESEYDSDSSDDLYDF